MSLDKFYETTDTSQNLRRNRSQTTTFYLFIFNTFLLFSSLTGNTVFVCTLGKNRIQVCKAPPGLHLALKAFEVVQVIG